MSVPGAMQPPDISTLDPGLQPALIALIYLFPGLALLVLIVRFWRKWSEKLLGGDDALIVVGWILCLANSIFTHLFVKAMYNGYRDEDVPLWAIDFKHAMKLQYGLSATYSPCINIIKASFLWSLYKLRSRNPWIKRSIIALQVINTIHMVVVTVIGAVPCVPVAKQWDPDIPGGCWNPLLYVKANISIVIVTDFLVLCIPTWMIWDLQMPLKRKIITIAFLSSGVVVIAIGIARLLWLIDAFNGKTKSYSLTPAYSAVESSVAIIGTSGPTIKYILSRCIPWLRPSWERASTNKRSDYAYGDQSNVSASRGHRSMHGTTGYNDMDEDSLGNDEIELKGSRGWQSDLDGHSEERSSSRVLGITKSVEWEVHSRDTLRTSNPSGADKMPATSPSDVI